MAELTFRRRARTKAGARAQPIRYRRSAAERLGSGCLDPSPGGPAQPERELFRQPRPRPRPFRRDREETVARPQPVAPRHARTVCRHDGVFYRTRGDMRPYGAALCRRTRRAGRFLCVLFRRRGQANPRFLHYPPQAATEDNTFGQGTHTDNCFLTALARTEVLGLTVQLPSGEWFPPPVIPGNLGNIMRRWSNDRFLSTPHGVLNDAGADRHSIAYFHSPNPDRVIECLPPAPARTTRRAAHRGLPRSRPRILLGELFPPEGPPLRSGRAGGRIATNRES